MNNIFVSSSFRDMQAERDMLRYIVLPRINTFLRVHYGQETNVVDLRWGIDTSKEAEESALKTIVQTCMIEIENCKPFMIVLIGDRYGTIAEKSLIMKSSRIEDAVIIPQDGMGITELEIRKGIRLMSEEKMNCLFYFRDMDYSKVPSEKIGMFFDEENSEVKAQKLKTLKSEIVSSFPDKCKHYSAFWNKEKNSVDGLQNLASLIVSDIESLIVSELGTIEPMGAMEISIKSEEAYCNAKKKLFIGRSKEIDSIKRFLDDPEKQILVIEGEAGCGKSALMCNILDCFKEAFDFITVFCGQGSTCDTADGVLRNVIYKLRRKMNISNADIADDLSEEKKLIGEQERLIKRYKEDHNKTLVIIYDGIDQLSNSEHTKNFFYVPREFTGVKCIITMSEGYPACYDALLFNHIVNLQMSTPSLDERISVVEKIWQTYDKYSVAEEVKEALLAKKHSNNYLYLNLILVRLSYMGREVFDTPNNSGDYIRDTIINIINGFPDGLDEAAMEVISSLSLCFRKDFLFRLVCLIASSNLGLRLMDLQELCKELWNGAEFSLIMQALSPFIFERFDHRFDFSHKVFKGISNALLKENSDSIVKEIHRYALSLQDEDSMKPNYLAHSVLSIQDGIDLFDYCIRFLETEQNTDPLSWAISSVIQSNEETSRLLADAFPIDKHTNELLGFVSEGICTHLSAGESTNVFLDRLSDRLSGSFPTLLALYDEEKRILVEKLASFEQNHHDIVASYTGKLNEKAEKLLSYCRWLYKNNKTVSNTIHYVNLLLDSNEVWTAGEILEREDVETAPVFLILKAKYEMKEAERIYPKVIICESEEGSERLSTAYEYLSKAKTMIDRYEWFLDASKLLLAGGKIYMRVKGTEGSAREWISSAERAGFYSAAETAFITAKHLCRSIIGTQDDTTVLGVLRQIIEQEVTILHYCPYICSLYKCSNEGFKTLNDDFNTIRSHISVSIRESLSPRNEARSLYMLYMNYADYLLSSIKESNPYESPYSDYTYSKKTMQTLYELLQQWNALVDDGIDVLRRLIFFNPTVAMMKDLGQILTSKIRLLRWLDPWSKETIDAYWQAQSKHHSSSDFKTHRDMDRVKIREEQLTLSVECAELFYTLQQNNPRGYLLYYGLVMRAILSIITIEDHADRFEDELFSSRFLILLQGFLDTVIAIMESDSSYSIKTILYIEFSSFDGLTKVLNTIVSNAGDLSLPDATVCLIRDAILHINAAKDLYKNTGYYSLDYYGDLGDKFYEQWAYGI